ncbi:MAG: alpha amylase C-terminal domain-containing protein, partial [Oscillospiraceae bacterium]|nr:alpha amylase C-terminal domain-containing protein [Oscillospiraceae bacterium]
MYYYGENYLLPFSHDENVHGKATVLQKMNGQYDDKFPQARALYLYMYTHPGKKLNFMGGEIGQLREWDESREQDWNILKYPLHDSFREFMKQLNGLYLSHSALYERDHEESGFRWIDCNNTENCIYAIERKSGSETLVGVFNFSDTEKKYALNGISDAKVLINTDWDIFSGGSARDEKIDTENMLLPKYSGILIQVQ